MHNVNSAWTTNRDTMNVYISKIKSAKKKFFFLHFVTCTLLWKREHWPEKKKRGKMTVEWSDVSQPYSEASEFNLGENLS